MWENPALDSRYNETYQAAEWQQGEWSDASTELYALPLRSYDPILGRFHSPDPYQQFHSPYLANFNNPANFVDPSGGWGECFWEAAEAFFKNTKGAVGKNGFATGIAVVQTIMVAVNAVRNIGDMHDALSNAVDQLAGEMAIATTGNVMLNNNPDPELRQTYITYYYGYNPDGTMYFMQLTEIWEEIPVSEMNGPMADEPVKVEAAWEYIEDLPVGQTAELCPGCESKHQESSTEIIGSTTVVGLGVIRSLIEQYPRIEPIEDLGITEWLQYRFIDDRIENGIVYDNKGYPYKVAEMRLQGPDLRGGFNKTGKGLKKLFKWFRKGKQYSRKALPALDVTGKLHGALPRAKDLHKYSREELEVLLSDLKKSVQRRIEKTVELGRDRGHGQRQGAEQDLIKSIEKYLNK